MRVCVRVRVHVHVRFLLPVCVAGGGWREKMNAQSITSKVGAHMQTQRGRADTAGGGWDWECASDADAHADAARTGVRVAQLRERRGLRHQLLLRVLAGAQPLLDRTHLPCSVDDIDRVRGLPATSGGHPRHHDRLRRAAHCLLAAFVQALACGGVVGYKRSHDQSTRWRPVGSFLCVPDGSLKGVIPRRRCNSVAPREANAASCREHHSSVHSHRRYRGQSGRWPGADKTPII